MYYIQGHLKCVSYIFSRLHSIWISGKLRCRKRHFSTLLIISLSINLRFIKKESQYLWLLCINLGFIILNNTSYVSSSHWWYFFPFKSENINPRCYYLAQIVIISLKKNPNSYLSACINIILNYIEDRLFGITQIPLIALF